MARSKENKAHLNVRAATLHIMGDLIQSVGVIIAAIIMKIKPEWLIIDPICTFTFSLLVICTTVPIFKECVAVVLESSPDAFNVDELFN